MKIERSELVERFESNIEKGIITFFDVEEFNEIIQYYLDVFDVEYIEKAINEAFNQYPNNINFKIREIEFYLSTEDMNKAYNIISELEDLCVESLDFYLVKAEYWAYRGFNNKSIKVYYQALKLNEETDYLYNCIGEQLIIIKEYQEAINILKKSLDIYPDEAYPIVNIVLCFRELDNFNQAIEYLEELSNLVPYNPILWLELGLLYFDLENYKKALTCFDFLYAIEPRSLKAYKYKALCLEKMDLWEQAIETYNQALEYKDDRSENFYNLANALDKIGDYEKALLNIIASIKEDKNNHEAYYKGSLIYGKIINESKPKNKHKRNSNTLYFINKALEIDPNNIIYIERKIQICELLNFNNVKLIQLKKLSKLEPYNYDYCINQIKLMINLGYYRQSIKKIIQSLKRFDKIELQIYLYKCYEKTNQHKNLINCKKNIKRSCNKKDLIKFKDIYDIYKNT